MRLLVCAALAHLGAIRPASAGELGGIHGVAVSKPFFNPTIGQKIRIDLEVGRSGSIALLILDRDGFLVRRLVPGEPIQAGKVAYDWDGRDERGDIVPDEAYSLKIDLAAGGEAFTYFPGNQPSEKLAVAAYSYDRPGAVLSYRLSKPARVHIQAGIARRNPKTSAFEGPVLKTVVNREPRPAGAVVENWNGFDESGAFYVPDLTDFSVGISPTSLPENAMIAFGNRDRPFLKTVSSRTGASLFTFRVEDHGHHSGLTALEDVAPRMKAGVLNGEWSPANRTWSTKQPELRVAVSLEGPSASAFATLPSRLQIFLDGKMVREIERPFSGMTVRLPRPPRSGTILIAFNWVSAFGPVAVDAFRADWGGGGASAVASSVSDRK